MEGKRGKWEKGFNYICICTNLPTMHYFLQLHEKFVYVSKANLYRETKSVSHIFSIGHNDHLTNRGSKIKLFRLYFFFFKKNNSGGNYAT